MTQTVRTVNIRGKDYVDVAERVRLCNADQGFSMIGQERYSIGERHFFSVTIIVKDKQYIGDAEIKFAAPKNSPDGTNPVECAQTSALGRALGFAGYGTLESIASADEVLAAISAQEHPTVQTASNGQPQERRVVDAAQNIRALPAPQPEITNLADQPINSGQMDAIRLLCKNLGRNVPDGVQQLDFLKAKGLIQTLTSEWNVARQKQQSNRAAGAK